MYTARVARRTIVCVAIDVHDIIKYYVSYRRLIYSITVRYVMYTHTEKPYSVHDTPQKPSAHVKTADWLTCLCARLPALLVVTVASAARAPTSALLLDLLVLSTSSKLF